MPLVEHPLFQEPPASATLWRYIDLAKYLDLLSKRHLWMSRADLLSDPYEGSRTQPDVAQRVALAADLDPVAADNFVTHAAEIGRFLTIWMYISCWHLNEAESAAMWRTYMIGHGITIVTTTDRLGKSIIGPEEVSLSVVQYIDYETDSIPADNVFHPFLHKRRSFEHEREVRAICMQPPTTAAALHPSQQAEGIGVSVDVNRLVSEVRVAPDSPSWFRDVVEDVTRKYGFDFPVRRSSLAADPLF